MSLNASSAIAIVPAAGISARMGQPKLLLPWGESTMIETVIGAWHAAGIDRVLVVVRADDEALAARCRAAGARVVQPTVPPPDMKASVRQALQAARTAYAPTDDDAWLLAPADMPRLSSRLIVRLLAEHNPGDPTVLIPVVDGRRGHPILVPWRWAAAVDELQDGEGINTLVARLPVREITTDDPGIRVDLDTPDDYRRARSEETSPPPDEPVN